MVCELLAEAFKRKTVDPRSFVDAILPQLVLESPEDGQQTMYTLFLYLLFKVEAPVSSQGEVLKSTVQVANHLYAGFAEDRICT